MNATLWMRCLCIWVAALVAGCATPKPVLDLAAQGGATVSLAEIALRDYLAITRAQFAARMDLMRAEAASEVQNTSRREIELFLEREAGIKGSDDVARRIRELGVERGRLRQKAAEELRALERTFTVDAAALPQVPAEKLAAARKSFGVLAQELTSEEWVALVVAYAREIKSGLEGLEKAGEPAQADGK